MASDTSAVDASVIAKLSSDATLMALMADGVYWDLAPNGKTKFVIVSQLSHADENGFDGRLFETIVYLVKAVDRNQDGTTAKSAASRIDVLLQDVPLTITGYTHTETRRIERVRYTEDDDLDSNIRWQHRGGHYELMVSPS